MKKVLCILFSIWTSISLAQSTVMDSLHDEVNIIAGYLDSKAVIVRWVPSTPAVWSYSAYYGYRLERCEVDTLTGDQTKWIPLGDSIMNPASLEQWRAERDRENNFGAGAEK